MTDNKLSELSKPVAYDYQIADACIADGHNENGKWVDWNNKLSRYCPPDWMVEEGKVTELKPLYSQEYVSALLAELEAKDNRIAELEAEITNIVDSHAETVAELRAKLATPVRLTDAVDYSDLDATSKDREVIKAIAECKGWNANRLEQAALLKKQEFKVEGANDGYPG